MRREDPLVAWIIVGFCLGAATFLLGILGVRLWRKSDSNLSKTTYSFTAYFALVALGGCVCCPLLAWLWYDLYPGTPRLGLGASFPVGFVLAVVAWRKRDHLPRLIGMQARPQWRKSNTERELERIAGDSFCQLTTTGRKSGQPHVIQIWFAVSGRSVYLLSVYKDQAHWVRNLLKQPRVNVLISKRYFMGVGRLVTDPEEQRRARRLLATKYGDIEPDGTHGLWAREALPIAVDIDGMAPE
jgi:deazaflavin-dependent oxidoreductase (nitroreductase family)